MLKHTILLPIGLLLMSGCVSINQTETLSATLGPVVCYINEQGEQYQAQYGSLSDDSLHFVKVTMPDNRCYTLPQVVSASGVRYTDERELVWWTHQGEVQITTRDASGDWERQPVVLKEISGTK